MSHRIWKVCLKSSLAIRNQKSSLFPSKSKIMNSYIRRCTTSFPKKVCLHFCRIHMELTHPFIWAAHNKSFECCLPPSPGVVCGPSHTVCSCPALTIAVLLKFQTFPPFYCKAYELEVSFKLTVLQWNYSNRNLPSSVETPLS